MCFYVLTYCTERVTNFVVIPVDEVANIINCLLLVAAIYFLDVQVVVNLLHGLNVRLVAATIRALKKNNVLSFN